MAVCGSGQKINNLNVINNFTVVVAAAGRSRRSTREERPSDFFLNREDPRRARDRLDTRTVAGNYARTYLSKTSSRSHFDRADRANCPQFVLNRVYCLIIDDVNIGFRGN